MADVERVAVSGAAESWPGVQVDRPHRSHGAPGGLVVDHTGLSPEGGGVADDQELAQEAAARVVVLLQPVLQIGATDARVRDGLIEVVEEHLFGDDGQVAEGDMREVGLADAGPTIQVTIEGGVVPGKVQEVNDRRPMMHGMRQSEAARGRPTGPG
jgi:hypothetical protein